MSSQIRDSRLNSGSIQSGVGVPNHIANIGTLYIDKITGIVYINKNNLADWAYMQDSQTPSSGDTGSIKNFEYLNNTFYISDSDSTYPATINVVTGLTVNGSLSANTISASTYYNLPTDIKITGGTYSNGTTTFTNNTGGTFTVTGYYTGSTEIFTTGATYNSNTFTYTNNTGGTYSVLFNVVTGLTVNGNLTITGNTSFQAITGATLNITGDTKLSNSVSAKTLIGIVPSSGSWSATTPDALTINSSNGGISFIRPTDFAQMKVLSAPDSATLKVGGTNQNNIDLYAHTDFVARFTNSPTPSVGILTSSPQATLDVSGNTRITGTLTASTISATTYQNLPTNIVTTGATYNNNTFTYTNNTGGTYSVLFNTITGLTVNGNLSATTISATSYSNLPNTLYTGDGSLSGNRIINISGFSLNFSSSTAQNTLVLNSGSVGIGRIPTTYLLEVAGTALISGTTNSSENTAIIRQTNTRTVLTGATPYTPNLSIYNSSGTLNTFNLISFQHSNDIDGTRVGVARVGTKLIASDPSGSSNNFRGDLFFQVRNLGSIFDAMYIRYDGNVGIGTSAPAFTLDVNGTARILNGLTANTVSSTTINSNSISLSTSASTINLTNTSQQQIRFFSGGTGTPTLTNYSAGAKIILYDNIDSSISTGYAIGVDAGTLWYGADLAGDGHAWYGGTRKLASLIGASGFQIIGLGGPGTSAAMTISGTSALGSKGGAGYTDFLQVINNWSAATNPNKWFRVNSTGGLEILRNDYGAQILSLSDGGVLSVGGGNTSATLNNDPTTNYLSFNNNNSSIYDDGNTHIHSRGGGGSMWLNTNGGAIILGNQSPVLGGAAASGIIMGSGSTTIKAFANIYGGKSYSIGSYGFLYTGGAGNSPAGTTGTFGLYVQNRIEAAEFDATSDERLKNIQGEIELDDAIKLVNNLKPIKFTWKDNESEGIKAGYSAQQVVKSGFNHLIGHIKNEDLIETTDDEGFTSPDGLQLTMNYDQVTPYHGVVLKHLLEKIEQLEKEIKELKAK
jgi:hypothetical protein